jgi:DNA-binding MarR family transcriptional regulator
MYSGVKAPPKERSVMTDRPDGKRGRPSADELSDAFARTGKILVRKMEDRLGESGASIPRSRVLVEVANRGPVRVTDVAATVGIAQGTASTLLEALVRDGLVTRTEDPSDRRATGMIATPKGQQQAEAWLRAYQAITDELFSVLPRSSWPQLLEMLSILGGQE